MKKNYCPLVMLALVCFFCTATLQALVDFTIVDTWDLGNKVTGPSLPLSANRYVSTTIHTVDVYEVASTSIERVQTLFTPDMICGWYSRSVSGDRLYISTQYTGVLVYQILPDITLAYLDKIPLQPGLGGLDYNDGVWVFGDTMVVSQESLDYEANQNLGSYFEVYDISNLAAPQLLARHQFQPTDFLVNVTAVPGGYYLTGFLDAVYFTPDLITFQQQNILPDHVAGGAIRNTFLYMGKLHYIRYYNNQLHLSRYTINPDHSLSPDWTLAVPQLSYCDQYYLEPGRVCLIGSDAEFGFHLISYIPSAGEWTQEYIRPWAGSGLHKLPDGYIGHGEGRAYFYDQQLSFVHNICITPYQRAVGLIANRWVMFRGLLQDFGSQPLTFYDLETRQWVNVQTIKTEIISRYRKGTDYFCVAEGNTVQILRFQPDGTCQTTEYTMPYSCFGLDVLGDRMAILHPIGSQMFLKVYDISSGTPVVIASRVISQYTSFDVLFYDADHIVVSRILTDTPNIDFFRVETNGAITGLANIMVVDYNQMYVEPGRILTGRNGGAVIDTSDPDNPHITGYTDPMVPCAYGGFISHEGNNYLFSDSMMWLSYITDSNFHVRDTFISEYSWYRSPNHILMQSWNTLFEVEHQAYAGIDDPPPPDPANIMGLPFPNPFRDAVSVECKMPESGNVVAEVFNIRGQKLLRLMDGFLDKGNHTLNWDGTDGQGKPLPTGVYLLRLSTHGQVFTRRMILMK